MFCDKLFSRPVYFQEFLSHHGLIDDLYKALVDPDPCAPVEAVLEIFKKTKNIPALIKETKSEVKSTNYRNEGNEAYKRGRNQSALLCYNKALLYAPTNSRAMKLAYSNRSALYFKLKVFSACLNDIEACFALGCPVDIIQKLKKRKEEARSCLWMEGLAEGVSFTIFSEEFFQLNVTRNPQIACASTNVGVIVESQVPKIVAANDVKVGTVLAVETAFVSQLDKQNTYFSCYYCHKMSLNLKPCEGCCFALFCDEDCKERCMTEYHRIECDIIEVLEVISSGTVSRLAIKAFLKIKHMCKNWNTLISASLVTGFDRIKSSSINEIYDSASKFSLLNVKDERHFLNGPMYNASFINAIIIFYLDTVCRIFPSAPEEKNAAIKAAGRILMCLSLYSTHVQSLLSMSIAELEKVEFHDIGNYGWYSFIGKLKSSCTPNVIAIGLNKKLALVALQPIKRGTELTLSYLDHWLDCPLDKEIRNKNMFTLYGVVCDCLICTGDYKLRKYTLNDIQKKSFKKLNFDAIEDAFNPRTVPEIYKKLCKTLSLLSDVPYSDEYRQVYRLFRKCILCLQDNATSNVILNYF